MFPIRRRRILTTEQNEARCGGSSEKPYPVLCKTPTKKAQGGGVQSLSPIAKDMYRGYDDVKRGVASYIPYMK